MASILENPIVTIEQGQLRGKIAVDYDDNIYYSFQGIPYAKPPLGNLRFRAPEPPEPWQGIFDATQEGSECYQRDPITKTITGSENCLFVNVYTPKIFVESKNQLKPVMVWIHGGAFMYGSSKSDRCGPEFLITQDVVVVTFNYRVGALGFLSMEDQSLGASGNAGLKDMVMVLKWVQKNIKSFTGDPNNVTIFGVSAGGAAVHYLYLSPMAKGLFHKAIAQSGSALNPWAYGKRCAVELAQEMGCKNTNEKEVLEFLTKSSIEQLFKAQESIIALPSQMRPFGPVIEKPSEASTFLTELPINIIRSKNYVMLPFLTGFVNREGMIFALRNQEHIKNLEAYVPWMLQIPKNSNISKQIADKIKDFYYDNEEPNLATTENTYLLDTDSHFLKGIYDTIRYQAINSSPSTYFYRISLETKLNWFKKMANIKYYGVPHTDELGYLFKMKNTPKIKPGSIEDISIRRFTKLWATFARYGNPNPAKPDALINIEWKSVRAGELNCLDIGENLTVGINPEIQRMHFWDKIYNTKP